MHVHEQFEAAVAALLSPLPTLTTVDVWRVEPYEIRDLPAADVSISSDELEHRNAENDYRRALLEVSITAHDTSASPAKIRAAAADIVAALLVSPVPIAGAEDLELLTFDLEVEEADHEIARGSMIFALRYEIPHDDHENPTT